MGIYSEDRYIKFAQENYVTENIAVDTNAIVEDDVEGGAWVEAHIWIDDEEIKDEDES